VFQKTQTAASVDDLSIETAKQSEDIVNLMPAEEPIEDANPIQSKVQFVCRILSNLRNNNKFNSEW
jgi:hypothetical protein